MVAELLEEVIGSKVYTRRYAPGVPCYKVHKQSINLLVGTHFSPVIKSLKGAMNAAQEATHGVSMSWTQGSPLAHCINCWEMVEQNPGITSFSRQKIVSAVSHHLLDEFICCNISCFLELY